MSRIFSCGRRAGAAGPLTGGSRGSAWLGARKGLPGLCSSPPRTLSPDAGFVGVGLRCPLARGAPHPDQLQGTASEGTEAFQQHSACAEKLVSGHCPVPRGLRGRGSEAKTADKGTGWPGAARHCWAVGARDSGTKSQRIPGG